MTDNFLIFHESHSFFIHSNLKFKFNEILNVLENTRLLKFCVGLFSKGLEN